MVEYTFKSDSNSATKKVAEFIKGFKPKVNFTIDNGHFGLEINCKFDNEKDRDSFINTLSESLRASENGSYIG